jgi:hypothetical protein
LQHPPKGLLSAKIAVSLKHIRKGGVFVAVYTDMVKGMKIPKMALVRQRFDATKIENYQDKIRAELRKPEIAGRIRPGMKVAITAGSRGVYHIADFLREIASYCREQGADPFIFPAMGSHGGGTAQGNLEVLKGYGVTEEACGCPIKASMETKVIGYTQEGDPVQIDRYASEADAVILINRVKPHTAFTGPYESGLMKMMTIGMGKHKGAEVCHRRGFGEMHRLVPMYANVILKNTPIAFGVAIVENAYKDTCLIEAIPAEQIPSREPELLKYAYSRMGRILIPETDILIVDYIGKNFSGEGADPNITGRCPTPYRTGNLKSERAVCLRISPASHGSAYGSGLFDFTTQQLVDAMDPDLSYTNSITSTITHVSSIPMVFPNDKLAIQGAIRCLLKGDKENPRIIRIKNTSEIEEIFVSEALLETAENTDGMTVLGEATDMIFDQDGLLMPK